MEVPLVQFHEYVELLLFRLTLAEYVDYLHDEGVLEGLAYAFLSAEAVGCKAYLLEGKVLPGLGVTRFVDD
mgnify:FL=1